MAKNTLKIAHPQPHVEEPETGTDTGTEGDNTLADFAPGSDSEPKPDPLAGSRRFNIPQFVTVNKATNEENLGDKAQRLSEIKQRLAEAKDMADKGGEAAEAANQTLGECGLALYEMRAAGLIGPEIVTATLGDVYGFQKRGKGGSKVRVPAGSKDASATPFGPGEVIRKRIVRLAAANDYVANGNRSAFFEGLAAEEVQPVIDTLQDGGSVWSAYQALTDLKATKRANVSTAFNPKSIAGIDDKLSEPGAVNALIASNELRVAYNNLLATIVSVITECNEALSSEGDEGDENENETETETA